MTRWLQEGGQEEKKATHTGCNVVARRRGFEVQFILLADCGRRFNQQAILPPASGCSIYGNSVKGQFFTLLLSLPITITSHPFSSVSYIREHLARRMFVTQKQINNWPTLWPVIVFWGLLKQEEASEYQCTFLIHESWANCERMSEWADLASFRLWVTQSTEWSMKNVAVQIESTPFGFITWLILFFVFVFPFSKPTVRCVKEITAKSNMSWLLLPGHRAGLIARVLAAEAPVSASGEKIGRIYITRDNLYMKHNSENKTRKSPSL